jgi:NAD(P)-dependent dehydrogenase (short-subunit alcohol dehydrogenase family)
MENDCIKTSLVIGGLSGIGLVIKEALIERGDKVYTASRSEIDSIDHFKIDLPSNYSINLPKKLDYLIFAQRYRGYNWDLEFDVMIKSVNLLVKSLQENFSEQSSIVILGSNAGNFVISEQSASYHASRAALLGLTKYLAVELGQYGIRCNALMPSTLIKPENSSFFSQDNQIRKTIEKKEDYLKC